MNRLPLLEIAPARLVARRLAACLTQAQLAAALGVSTRTVKRWEATGRIKPVHYRRLRDMVQTVEAKVTKAWRAAETRRFSGASPNPQQKPR